MSHPFADKQQMNSTKSLMTGIIKKNQQQQQQQPHHQTATNNNKTNK